MFASFVGKLIPFNTYLCWCAVEHHSNKFKQKIVSTDKNVLNMDFKNLLLFAIKHYSSKRTIKQKNVLKLFVIALLISTIFKCLINVT